MAKSKSNDGPLDYPDAPEDNNWPNGSQRSKIELTDSRSTYTPSMEEIRGRAGYGVLDLSKCGVAVPYDRIPSHKPPNPFQGNGDFEYKF